MGYSSWGHKELDTIEHACTHAHTHLSHYLLNIYCLFYTIGSHYRFELLSAKLSSFQMSELIADLSLALFF